MGWRAKMVEVIELIERVELIEGIGGVGEGVVFFLLVGAIFWARGRYLVLLNCLTI